MLAARRMMNNRHRTTPGPVIDSFFTAQTNSTSSANRSGIGTCGAAHATLLNLISSFSGAFSPPQSVTSWPSGLTPILNSGAQHGALSAAAVDSSPISAGAWPSISNAGFAMGSAGIVWVGVNVTNGGAAATLVDQVGAPFLASASGSVTIPGTVLPGDLLLMLAAGGEIGGTPVTFSVDPSAVDSWTTQELDTAHGQVQWLFASAIAGASSAGSTFTINSNKGTNTWFGVSLVAFR